MYHTYTGILCNKYAETVAKKKLYKLALSTSQKYTASKKSLPDLLYMM